MVSKTPRFSILINNYNYARFLDQAIESCLSQTFTDYEIIVIDDYSTDHSIDICKRYGSQIKLIQQPYNQGQGAAFNVGVQHCQGAYVCMLDADDIFIHTKLEILARELDQCHNSPDLIHHQMYRVNQNLIKLENQPFPRSKISGRLHDLTKKYGKQLIAPTSALTFKKTFLDKILPICPFRNRINADLTLELITCLIGDVYAVMQSLSLYRLHGINNFANTSQSAGNHQEIRKNISDIELNYDSVNLKLPEISINEKVYVMNHIYFQGMQTIIGNYSWLKFLINLINCPIFEIGLDKIKFFRWVLKSSKANQKYN